MSLQKSCFTLCSCRVGFLLVVIIGILISSSNGEEDYIMLKIACKLHTICKCMHCLGLIRTFHVNLWTLNVRKNCTFSLCGPSQVLFLSSACPRFVLERKHEDKPRTSWGQEKYLYEVPHRQKVQFYQIFCLFYLWYKYMYIKYKIMILQ